MLHRAFNSSYAMHYVALFIPSFNAHFKNIINNL